MELDLHTKQHLSNLLAKPAMVTPADADMLLNLAKTYPYYQPLHLLLAKAKANTLNSEHSFASAALYNGGQLLHQIIHQPENLIASKLNLVSFAAIKADENLANQQLESAEEIEFIAHLVAEPDEQEVFEEIAELNIHQPVQPAQETDEVFDEIAEVNTEAYAPTAIDTVEAKEEVTTNELAIENIVASDFFAFEKSFGVEPTATQKAEPKTITQPEEYDQEAEAQTISKYDDDKLPYTFLWWLAKTRKEHEQIFQPYVTPKQQVSSNQGELQQQYVEHIFHLQTPFNVADETTKGPLNKQIITKGTEIINSFIKNEPQIRPPKAEQINNENKAKKSAEDHNDLVSETLAAIYIEQILYHKAIDTYEKLSLKFPEKSRYFADLIQSLEKKI